MKNNIVKVKEKNTGFVLFIALLTASFLLAVGLGVSSLAIRGFQLTSNTTESIKALYAANAGIECALYWDIKNSGAEVFPLVDSTTDYIAFPPPNVLSCSQNSTNEEPNSANFGGLAPDYIPSRGGNTNTIGFWLSFRTDENRQNLEANGPCVYITINKQFIGSPTNGQIKTVVNSYGYNLHGVTAGGALSCIPSNIVSSSQIRVERQLQAQY